MRVPVGGPSAPVQSPNTATPPRATHPTPRPNYDGPPNRYSKPRARATRTRGTSSPCGIPTVRICSTMPPCPPYGAAIRREHPEMVGESIVQEFLMASIVLCTFGSMVSVYEYIHRGRSAPPAYRE